MVKTGVLKAVRTEGVKIHRQRVRAFTARTIVLKTRVLKFVRTGVKGQRVTRVLARARTSVKGQGVTRVLARARD